MLNWAEASVAGSTSSLYSIPLSVGALGAVMGFFNSFAIKAGRKKFSATVMEISVSR